MRRYELMLLLRPDLEDDKLQSAVEKVTRAIVNAGGSLSKVSPWGKRRLAYDVKNFREASYFLIHFDIEPGEVRGIERGLLISEEILRHLVIVLEERGTGDSDDEIPAAEPFETAPRPQAVETDDSESSDRERPDDAVPIDATDSPEAQPAAESEAQAEPETEPVTERAEA